MDCLDRAFVQGYHYKRAGVILMDISSDRSIQTDLIDYHAEQYQKLRKLDKVVDHLNQVYGTETLICGSQQYPSKDADGKATHFADAIRRDRKSPNFTTRWSDLLIVK